MQAPPADPPADQDSKPMSARVDPAFPDHSGQWDGRRRAKTATDRAMTGAALEWVMSLPAHLRPKQLCDRFPRIANMLAGVWTDRVACLQALTALVEDKRGRRRGFPVVLRQEIQRLIEYREKKGN
jgi:hypothetical protein